MHDNMLNHNTTTTTNNISNISLSLFIHIYIYIYTHRHVQYQTTLVRPPRCSTALPAPSAIGGRSAFPAAFLLIVIQSS